MKQSEYLEYLDQALESDCGIKVPSTHNPDAEAIRIRLYKLRERLRREGSRQYDHLSFRIFGFRELWIVRKDALGFRDDGIPNLGPGTKLERLSLWPLMDSTKT